MNKKLLLKNPKLNGFAMKRRKIIKSRTLPAKLCSYSEIQLLLMTASVVMYPGKAMQIHGDQHSN